MLSIIYHHFEYKPMGLYSRGLILEFLRYANEFKLSFQYKLFLYSTNLYFKNNNAEDRTNIAQYREIMAPLSIVLEPYLWPSRYWYLYLFAPSRPILVQSIVLKYLPLHKQWPTYSG